uniref:Family with sequence similarity 83 member G n=1 Tax=Varanus komodoensis TaxID=61221 RepID=A0A8D2LWS2_VARKO
MAFSQVQCLDDNHVNWRSSESKPEFFYSEGQRLALEALVSRGPEAFYEVLKKENIRDFLSGLELQKVLDSLETYDPGSEFIPRGDGPLDLNSPGSEPGPVPSSDYWPERSDRSIPQLDLGWPETVAYRGVTRATVYMQPPIDYQPHIKEVVRKMIFQAQKVVAVVMDMFTDVDIFKDLLEAGFKRKVAIYIIVDESNLKYFLQMCERVQMHAGHLKNLRVRTTGGTEFLTRSATRFKGALAQKFMFVDGDKAMIGSYSFTWSAARTDRNAISVLSGQVVEAFDKQFQELYLLSRGVSLRSIPMDKEPEPEPVVLPTVLPLSTSHADAKKIVNPKYALVKAKSADQISGSEPSSLRKPAQEQQSEARGMAIPEGRVSERPSALLERAPPVHPGLQNLERANMFDYLPTWVEPDPEPGSEVLGYINIIDPKIKNIQLSQMNRIKVCDVANAHARRKHAQKAPEARTGPQEPSATTDGSRHPQPPLDAAPPDRAVSAAPAPDPQAADVTDSLAAAAAQAQEGTGGTSPGHDEGAAQSPEAGRRGTLSRQGAVSRGAVNGLPEGEAEEGEEEDYASLSDHESLPGTQGCSPRPSDASSISDEYFEVRGPSGPLRRTSLDFLPNGGVPSPPPRPPMQRKLSEPHVSRGSFTSPLGSPQALLSLEEASQRRGSDSVEEIRSVARGSRRKPCFPGPPPLSTPLAVLWAFRSPGRARGGWAAGGGGGPPRAPGHVLPQFQEGQRAPEELRTPLGIPLSKLSQSKHLKSKAGQWPDPKRRHPGAAGRKDQ